MAPRTVGGTIFDTLITLPFRTKPRRSRWFVDIDPRVRSAYEPKLMCSRWRYDFTMNAAITPWHRGLRSGSALG